MTSAREIHDRLGSMIDQVGHPDYSLRELVKDLCEVRDGLLTLTFSAGRYGPHESPPKTRAEKEAADITPTIASSSGYRLPPGWKLERRDESNSQRSATCWTRSRNTLSSAKTRARWLECRYALLCVKLLRLNYEVNRLHEKQRRLNLP